MPKTKETCFALAAFALGVAAFVKTQQLTAESMAPLAEACSTYTSVADFTSNTEFIAYEPLMGFGIFRQFVCIITNFMYGLKTAHPAGLMVWGTTMCVAQPVGVLMYSEASRAGSFGLVRYSILIGLLAQILGISVIFPAVWVPSSCLGRGQGGVTPMRVYSALAISMPSAVLSALLFSLHHETYGWKMAAATLGGPGFALLPLLLWPLSKPTGDPIQAKSGQSALVNSFMFAGVVAFVIWWYLLWVALHSYDSPSSFFDDVWMEATSDVAFMAVDAVVLYLGLLLYLAYLSGTTLVSSILWLPFLGPGAAIAFALSAFEIERQPVTKNKTA